MPEQKKETTKKDTAPDWTHQCEVCGATPVVPITGMCGPCTFGEADTAGGNWTVVLPTLVVHRADIVYLDYIIDDSGLSPYVLF